MSQSPNFGPRRDGLTPTLIILHYTAMSSANAARDRLCDPSAEVSAHYLIARTGEVISLVDEDMRAWHAGAGEWQGQDDINSRSIGIELDNDGSSPFSAPLMDALVALLPGIMTRWDIRAEHVIGHADMAPGRKVDPGRRLDWKRLQRHGLAAWPDVEPVPELYGNPMDPSEAEDLLNKVGYTGDGPINAKLTAFRDRFLPASIGAPNGADRLMLLHYLNDYPVDPPATPA